MTPRSFFNLVLKILGLFLVKGFLELIPYLLSSLVLLTSGDMLDQALWNLVSTLAMMAVYWFAFYYLIFKTELIIDQLKLDKGFEQETFSFNMHRSSVLSIAVIILGGWLAISEIPDLCERVYNYFWQKRITGPFSPPPVDKIIFSLVKIGVGIFLMAGQRQIVNFIELRRKK